MQEQEKQDRVIRAFHKQIAFSNEDYLTQMTWAISYFKILQREYVFDESDHAASAIVLIGTIINDIEQKKKEVDPYVGTDLYTIRDYERDFPEDKRTGKNARFSIKDVADAKRKNMGTTRGLDDTWCEDEPGEKHNGITNGLGFSEPA